MRDMPRTINWEISTAGAVKIAHTDDHSIEVWETYMVTAPFTQSGATFSTGDVLMYLSQYNKDKKQGVGTMYFRHLQKLLD